MSRNNFLDRIFPGSGTPTPTQRKFNDISKFVDAFHNFSVPATTMPTTLKGVLPVRLPTKQSGSNQPLKKLYNHSELTLIGDSSDPTIRVESVKADYEPKSMLSTRSRYFHTISLERSHYNRDFIPSTDKKIKGFTTVDNNIETLPVQFARRSINLAK